MDTRSFYAEKHLKGDGIGCGALHRPLPVVNSHLLSFLLSRAACAH